MPWLFLFWKGTNAFRRQVALFTNSLKIPILLAPKSKIHGFDIYLAVYCAYIVTVNKSSLILKEHMVG